MHEGALPPPASLRVIIGDPALRVIMVVVFVIMLGFGIVAPILPLFARSFGVSYGAAGLLVSAFAFTRLAFDLVAGPIVDRWGEQRASVAGKLAHLERTNPNAAGRSRRLLDAVPLRKAQS